MYITGSGNRGQGVFTPGLRSLSGLRPPALGPLHSSWSPPPKVHCPKAQASPFIGPTPSPLVLPFVGSGPSSPSLTLHGLWTWALNLFCLTLQSFWLTEVLPVFEGFRTWGASGTLLGGVFLPCSHNPVLRFDFNTMQITTFCSQTKGSPNLGSTSSHGNELQHKAKILISAAEWFWGFLAAPTV